MKKNCLNWFLSAAFLFLLGSCANKVKPGQEPEVKEKFTFAYFTDVHLNKDNRGNGDVALRMALSDAKNYERFGKTIDLEKLAKGQYNISIILSASKNGDEFKGAPGSTLLIDDLEIEYK